MGDTRSEPGEPDSYLRVLGGKREVPDLTVRSLLRSVGAGLDIEGYSRDRVQSETAANIVHRSNEPNPGDELLQHISERAITYTARLLSNLDAAKELGHFGAELYLPIFPSEEEVVVGALDIVGAAMQGLGYSPKRERGILPHSPSEVQLGIDPPIFHRLSVRIFDA